MLALQTMPCCRELQEFVRVYAQRQVGAFASGINLLTEPIPARLEQLLEFQFGDPYTVFQIDGSRHKTPPFAFVGAHTSGTAQIQLRPGVLSFGIFFTPTGFSRLFGIPVSELTGRHFEATLASAHLRELGRRVADCSTFAERVNVAEATLLTHAASAPGKSDMVLVAEHIFSMRGTPRISRLALDTGLGFRQFERNFSARIGLSPKLFARVARFQTALDAKIASPSRSWAEIAHHLHYFDQMHMIHDFQLLGGDSPRRLVSQIGDARPVALAQDRHTTFFC